MSRRNLDEFLKDQNRFLEARTEKVGNLKRSMLEQEMSMVKTSPRIDPNSLLLCTARSTRSRAKSLEKGFSLSGTIVTQLPKVLDTEEKSKVMKRPKSVNKWSATTSRLLDPQSGTKKSIEKQKEERRMEEQKKEEKLRRQQRRAKEAGLALLKLGREIDQVCAVHCPDPNGLTFDSMRTLGELITGG